MKQKKFKFLFLAIAILVAVAVFIPLAGNIVHASGTSAGGAIGVPPPGGTPAPGSLAAQAAAQNQPPTGGNDDPYSCSVLDIATCVVYFISYAITYIAGLFIALAVWLVQLALNFNQNLINSPIVQTGFGIVLAIANLGLVIGIIVIAIATILRNATYGIKQALPKLIIVAIAINFGLVILNPLIGLSTSLSNTFINCMSGGASCQSSASAAATASGFAQTLTGKFSIQNLLQPPAGDTVSGDISGNNFMKAVMSLIFNAVFSFIIVLALLGLAVLLLVRYVMLGKNAITLPFEWAKWPFPKLGSPWGWWEDTLKWIFLPPIVLFFVYLAVITAGSATYQQSVGIDATSINNSVSQGGPTAALNGDLNTGPKNAGGAPGVLQVVADDVLLCGLLIGGLFAGSELAGSAGKTVVGAAKQATGAVTGYMSKKSKAAARSVGRNAADRIRASGKQYNPATRETTTRLQRVGSRLQNVPGLKAVGVGMANVGAPEAIKKGNEKNVQDYVDNNLKSLTNDGIKARATSKTAFVNPTQSAALAQELARRNMTTDTDIAPLMDRYVAAADRAGNLEKVTNNRPDLMPQRKDKTGAFIETKEDAIARAVRSAKGDVVQADADTFNRAHPRTGMTTNQVDSAVLALSPAQLSVLSSDTSAGSQARQNNLSSAVQDLVNSITGLKVRNATSGKFELDLGVLAGAVVTRPELANLDKIVKHMENNQNWTSALGNP